MLFGAAALGVLAGAAIAFVRTLLSFPFMQDFLVTYPGEYALPAGAQVGLPAWIGWQHFFNIFLMVLIIRWSIVMSPGTNTTGTRPSVIAAISLSADTIHR